MLRLPAPAKLNLYLRVVGRRPDGYHELETLFERITLADELTFEGDPRALRVTCSTPALSCGEENLVVKAARLLQHVTGTARGARIHLTKRIPIAAGLGGGSSDAATTLRGLNRLWNTNCSPQQLYDCACQLGSDVPFFLTETAMAIGRGRGELLEPVRDTRILWHVLVTPHAALSTKEIFTGAQFDLTARKPSSTIMLHALCNGSLGELAKGLYNELEPEAIRRCPLIETIHSRLRACGCVGTLMSGSGPAVYGLCEDAEHAAAVAQRLKDGGLLDSVVQVVKTAGAPAAVGQMDSRSS